MNPLLARYDRNIRLFGEEGQRRLNETTAAVIGIGGLGSPIVLQLALLGVGRLILVDDEELDDTNRNRFVGARHDDPVPGSLKIFLAARLAKEINPDTEVITHELTVVNPEVFDAIMGTDCVFGCFDDDGPRAILNEVCAAYAKPYIDVASDVPEEGVYGGRVCIAWDGNGCLQCFQELDQEAVRRYLSTDEERKKEDAIYGVPRKALGTAGPSVAPVNGVVANLAATEFMVAMTGMRRPRRFLEYRGHESKVLVRTNSPRPGCYYCKGIRGKPQEACVERYLELAHLRSRRRD